VADAQPRDDNDGIEPKFNLAKTEGSREASVASVSAGGEYGSIKASALGTEASGSASAGFGPGTVRAGASGSAGIYAAKVEAEVRAGRRRCRSRVRSAAR
jgi:hypothetical protein